MQIANISQNILLTKDVKRTFEENYIKMLFEKHRELPKSDIIEFVHKAQQTGANPSLNQIYLIERNTNVNGQWRKVGSVVFSYNFIQAIANQTKEYHGYESAISVQEKFDPFTLETKKTLCCHVVVKRNGHNYPYTAFFDEYVQTTKDGKPMGLWASKPYIMLEKCAISGALRRAFPEALSGIYCEEEMESASSEFDKLDKTKIIEATATEKIEKHIDLMEKINDKENGKLDEQLTLILEALSACTTGLSAKEKGVFLFQTCGVSKFNDLKLKSLDELKLILSQLNEVKNVVTTIKGVSDENTP